jgi:hypothetical protein
MAVNSLVHGHPLPCGRLVESIFDDVEAGRTDDHTLACAHCTTARRGVENLATATHALAEDPTEPPAGLVERIMQVARLELRRGESLPLPSTHGPADVSEHAVAAVLRYAADSVPGVRACSCRITSTPTIRPSCASRCRCWCVTAPGRPSRSISWYGDFSARARTFASVEAVRSAMRGARAAVGVVAHLRTVQLEENPSRCQPRCWPPDTRPKLNLDPPRAGRTSRYRRRCRSEL